MGLFCCLGTNPRAVAPAHSSEGREAHATTAQQPRPEPKAAAAGAAADDRLVELTQDLEQLLGGKPTQEGTKRAM
jgi:hypothetical protein